METIGGVIVTMIGDSTTMCDATGMTTLITFTHDPGDVPPLQPTDVTIASSGATANFWVRAGKMQPQREAVPADPCELPVASCLLLDCVARP